MSHEASDADVKLELKEADPDSTPWVHKDDDQDPNTVRPAPPSDVTGDLTVDFGGSKNVKVKNLKHMVTTQKPRSTSTASSTSSPTTPVAENVIGIDDRLKVSPTKSPPYRWVCYLELQTATGKYFRGTGFFSNILGPTYRFVIVTCGHNLFSKKDGGYMKSITVIPGRDRDQAPFGQFTVQRGSFRVSKAYQKNQLPDDDYGVIFARDPQLVKTIPKDVGYGFGSEYLSDTELRRRVVHVCGFPGDKPDATMWIGGGIVEGVSQNMIGYTTDTYGGNSGSPVWTWDVYNWKVVGIHAYGGVRENSARRMTRSIADEFRHWWWVPEEGAASTGDTGGHPVTPVNPPNPNPNPGGNPNPNPGGNPGGNPTSPKPSSTGCCSCLCPKTSE